MTTGASVGNELLGNEVVDVEGNKVGTVDSVWVDEVAQCVEFLGLSTGWIFGQTHIVPAGAEQVKDDVITLPYTTEKVKGAPHFDKDAEIWPTDENKIYQYFGVERSIEESPSGLLPGQSGEQTVPGDDRAGAGRRLRRFSAGTPSSRAGDLPTDERRDSPGAVPASETDTQTES